MDYQENKWNAFQTKTDLKCWEKKEQEEEYLMCNTQCRFDGHSRVIKCDIPATESYYNIPNSDSITVCNSRNMECAKHIDQCANQVNYCNFDASNYNKQRSNVFDRNNCQPSVNCPPKLKNEFQKLKGKKVAKVVKTKLKVPNRPKEIKEVKMKRQKMEEIKCSKIEDMKYTKPKTGGISYQKEQKNNKTNRNSISHSTETWGADVP